MSADRRRFARAASALVGSPFRLHGRDPRTGVDCVGLVGAALAAIGRRAVCPAGYRLRALDIRGMLSFADTNGFGEVRGAGIEGGDLLLVRPAPVQFHLVIAGERGDFVHAHAGLGLVTVLPAPLPWPVAHHWRLD